MHQRDPLFLPAPFFMARSPIFPIDQFFKMEKENFDCFSPLLKDPLFLEALAIASPSLYEAYKKIVEEAEKASEEEKKKVCAGLMKYLLRMATRSTPFGLFSFVSAGSFDESTSLNFDLSRIRKRARPDMEWFLNVLNSIYKDSTALSFLPVRYNPLLVLSGGRFFLNYFRNHDEDEKFRTVSIKASFLTQAILEKTKKTITVQDLQEKLIEEHPFLERDKLFKAIEELIKQEFLCYSPSLLTDSPFNDLLSTLSSAQVSNESLQEITRKIDCYRTSFLGEGVSALFSLQKSMQKIASSPHYVQVDSAYSGDSFTLPKRVAEELAEAAEVIWKLSSVQQMDPLKNYFEKFIEKFEISRLVPILELLQEGGEIGLPEEYTSLNLANDSKKDSQSKWSQWLYHQWIDCLLRGKKEIEITHEVLEKTIETVDQSKALLSFDLFCEILAQSPEQIDKGEYLLSIFGLSHQGGAAFGRFYDLFKPSVKEELSNFIKQEEALEEGCIFAESSYLPSIRRNANVAIQPSLRSHVVDTEGFGDISLDDICVGVNFDRFYLTLKNSSKELLVKSGNMLSDDSAPIPIRFMRDVTKSKYIPLASFPWKEISQSPYLPRVRFKKCILSAARWKISLFDLDVTKKESSIIIKEKLQGWIQEWKVPRFSFLGETDQRILIDLEHPSHLQEVCHQLKQGREVILTEKIGQDLGQWVVSEKGPHLTEFVVPFRKNPKHSKAENFAVAAFHPISSRWKLPGSEWLFIKYYLGKGRENRFLTEQVHPFIDNLLKQKIIDDWFFVRYTDPKPHLRLRLLYRKEEMIVPLINNLYEWGQKLLKEQLIYDMNFSAYEREVERYGGEALMSYAENFFCVDSKAALSLMFLLLKKGSTLSEEAVASLSIIDLLKGLGLSLEDQLNFFSYHTMPKEELSGFRDWKSVLVSKGELILDDLFETFSDPLFSILQERRKGLQLFKNELEEGARLQRLTLPPIKIYDSLIHMHCNRLLGMNGKKEMKARLFASHTLNAISKKNNVGAKSGSSGK